MEKSGGEVAEEALRKLVVIDQGQEERADGEWYDYTTVDDVDTERVRGIIRARLAELEDQLESYRRMERERWMAAVEAFGPTAKGTR